VDILTTSPQQLEVSCLLTNGEQHIEVDILTTSPRYPPSKETEGPSLVVGGS